MKPTDELVEEHDELRKMFEVMKGMADRLDGNQEVEPNHMIQVTDYLTVFIDKNHHAKEEKLLFPAMRESGDAEAIAPIDELLEEHDSSRELVRKMEKATPDDAATFTQSAREFIEAVGEHMDKEESVAFPAAKKALSNEVQNKLMKDFEKMEERALGSGGEERYEESLKRLKETYVEGRKTARKNTRRTRVRRSAGGSTSHSRAAISARARETRGQ